MKNVITIAKRELKSYFDSPIAYIVIVAFLAVAGWMYFSALFLQGRADMRSFFQPSPFSPTMLLVILAPAVTMRLIAEERKTGTIELLTTMPITDAEVIAGKFLAALGLIVVALGVTLFYPITVAAVGKLDWGPVVSGYLGIFLFSAALIAVGLLCSTFTRNQIVAFIVAFLVSAVLYFVFWLQFFLPEFLAPIVEYLSVSFHLDNLSRGVIDTRDVLYYLSVTAAALFFAERSLARQHA
ncbi:MAG: ABC transporter permease subunit [Deltaproteobacteria bacterium]|nr:ABC transporter permease subunit [Deltaproteobacteria bacterium]